MNTQCNGLRFHIPRTALKCQDSNNFVGASFCYCLPVSVVCLMLCASMSYPPPYVQEMYHFCQTSQNDRIRFHNVSGRLRIWNSFYLTTGGGSGASGERGQAASWPGQEGRGSNMYIWMGSDKKFRLNMDWLWWAQRTPPRKAGGICFCYCLQQGSYPCPGTFHSPPVIFDYIFSYTFL